MEDDKSAKENVIFYQKFDAQKYESAMSLVQLSQRCLGSDPLCEDIPVGELELSTKQIQKISLARSIYCDKYVFLYLVYILKLIIIDNVLGKLLY